MSGLTWFRLMFRRAKGGAWFAFRRQDSGLFLLQMKQGGKVGKALWVNDYGARQRDIWMSLDFRK